jgi:hypothetical protein
MTVVACMQDGTVQEFATLAEYEVSALWIEVRERYRASGLPLECQVCGREEIHLHHLSYRDLGRESFEDLMPLCEDHHYEVEKRIKRSDLDRRNATLRYVEECDARAEGSRARAPQQIRSGL